MVVDRMRTPDEQPETFEEEVVEGNLPCARCGVDLIGLEVTGSCPECGLRIALSMSDRLLRLSEPTWLEQVADGCRQLHWTVMGIFYVVAAGALTVYMDSLQVGYWWLGVVTAISALVLMGAAWRSYTMVVATERAADGRRRGVRVMMTLRIVGHAVFGLSLGATVYALAIARDSLVPAAAVSTIGAALLFWLALAVCNRLAARVPDVPLTMSNTAFHIAAVAYAVTAVYLMKPGDGAQTLRESLEAMPQLGMSFLLMSPLVLSLWAVALFWQTSDSIRKAASVQHSLDETADASAR